MQMRWWASSLIMFFPSPRATRKSLQAFLCLAPWLRTTSSQTNHSSFTLRMVRKYFFLKSWRKNKIVHCIFILLTRLPFLLYFIQINTVLPIWILCRSLRSKLPWFGSQYMMGWQLCFLSQAIPRPHQQLACRQSICTVCKRKTEQRL